MKIWEIIGNATEKFFDIIMTIIEFIFNYLIYIIGAIIGAAVLLIFIGFGACHRGCGYYVLDFGHSCIDGCSSTERPLQRTVAIEGEDYSKPEISFDSYGDLGKLELNMEFYDDVTLEFEICFMQDGVNLYTYEYEAYCNEGEALNIEQDINYSKYNYEGGEVYYVINRFEATTYGGY